MVDYKALANFDDTEGELDYKALAKFEEDPGIVARAQGALPQTSDFAEGYKGAIGHSLDTMASGYEDINKPGMDKVYGTGKLALGGLEYLASPFAAAGHFISEPIRRALGGLTTVGGVDPANVAADTAELAPLMFAPIPGAKTAEALGGGAAAVMGEAPGAMMALKNAVPYIKNALGFGGQSERAVSTPKADLEQGQTLQTSRVTPNANNGWNEPEWSPQDWYAQQFRGGGEPSIPPTGAPEPKQILGPKKPIGTKGTRQEILKEDYVNRGEMPTRRTSHLPRTPADEAPIDFYNEQFANDMAGNNVPTDIPIGGPASNVLPFHLPNIRDNTPVDPVLEQQIRDAYFRKQQTTPMQRRTGGGMPWAPTREPVTDPLDEAYSSYFNGPENAPTFSNERMGTMQQPPIEDASNDNLDAIYSQFFNKDQSPALSSPYRQSPMPGAEPLPSAPKPTPTAIPPERAMRGANSSLDDPTANTPRPDMFSEPGSLPRVPARPMPEGAPRADTAKEVLQKKLKAFKGGPVKPEEVPPAAMPENNARPAQPVPTPEVAPADFGGHAVGNEVEIVHNINGQEMRAPGGRIVQLITKHEPTFTKATRDAQGNMPNRVNYSNKGYAKLEDGREVPVSMLQPLKVEEKLPETPKPKTRVTSKAVKPKEPTAEVPAHPIDKALESAADRAIARHMEAQSKAPYTPSENVPPNPRRAETTKLGKGTLSYRAIKEVPKTTPTPEFEVTPEVTKAVDDIVYGAEQGAKIYYSDLMEQTGLSRSALDKIIDEMKKANPKMYRKTDKLKGPYVRFN